MRIKNFIRVIFFSVLFVGIATTYAASSDKIVALVNSDVITQSELDKKISIVKQQMMHAGQSVPSRSKLRTKALDELIGLSLQVQMAERMKIEITDKELDAVVANIARGNNLSVDQLKKQLSSEGISYRDFRRNLREQGVITRLHQQVFGKEIKVSDQEVNKLLRNPPKLPQQQAGYHVLDIVFAIDDGATKAQEKSTLKMANELLAKLNKGADVEKAVLEQEKIYKNQKIQLNDLVWRRLSDFPELFANKVNGMKKNQIAGPIEAPNGFHLLKLLDIQGQQIKFTKDRAYDIIFQRKLNEKLKPWLAELKSKAYIKINK